MIPKECKRLAEVDFPIAAVSLHSAREKSIRHGHPSTLHLWWARRPLGACRAMLMALLLPDPCDDDCPADFKTRARNILPRIQGKVGAKDIDLRNELLRFIAAFANWDNSANATFLEAARGLVSSAYGEDKPLVVDPFAGGGSIPLEALRMGCDAFASDLNPVACLILKTLLEDIPRSGPGLGEELRKEGERIKASTEKEISKFYPRDPDDSRPLAYLWARTVTCDSCGAEIPLVRSFWLCKKPDRRRALRHSVVKPKGSRPHAEFEIFEPKNENDVQKGTTARAKAVCICCNIVLPPERVRTQLAVQRGGADVIFDNNGKRIGGAKLMAVVTLKPQATGRQYRLATDRDYAAVYEAQQHVARLLKNWEQTGKRNLCPIPNEPITRVPVPFGVINVWVYGMLQWGDLFTARQKTALVEFASHCSKGNPKYPLTALNLSHITERNNALCRWYPDAYMETVGTIYGRQAIPMVWDFAEAVPLVDSSGGWGHSLDFIARASEFVAGVITNAGQVQAVDAAMHPLPNDSAHVWFTDPPYYDSVPYSYISDFFYVWLKRALSPSFHSFVDGELTPKTQEIVAYLQESESHESAYERYERRMAGAFAEGRRVLRDDGIGSVVFAHKTTEGWEALLSGLIGAGWTITSSWPITTEMASRLRARESAALATSIHLVCRARSENAPIGDWAQVLRELPGRVGDWIDRLQEEGIRGADLVFACIGPAMEIYSRYTKVEDAEGRQIPLGGDPTASEPYKRGFLAYVWETVGRLALEQVLGTAEARARNGVAGALEEDARLTALFLWTLQSTEVKNNGDVAKENEVSVDDDDEEEEGPRKKKAGYTLVYDVARRFAQPLGIHLDKWEKRIINIEKGVVRLLPISERAAQLFGDADAAAMGRRIEQDVKAQRNYTFAFMQDVGAAPEIKARRGGKTGKHEANTGATAPQQVTTLDRVHAAMLLQAGGQTNGLRALLREEQQRGPDFVRLANALSALYPKDSEEKRLLDAMLLAVPRN